MFEIRLGEQGEVVMSGRLDAAQCERALAFLDGVAAPRVVDLVAGVAILLVVLMWWNGRRER